jgi:hypothetical protein
MKQLDMTDEYEGENNYGLNLYEKALKAILMENLSETTINSYIVVEDNGQHIAVGYDPETDKVGIFMGPFQDIKPGTYIVIHATPLN